MCGLAGGDVSLMVGSGVSKVHARYALFLLLSLLVDHDIKFSATVPALCLSAPHGLTH